jgi:hypothetical protein
VLLQIGLKIRAITGYMDHAETSFVLQIKGYALGLNNFHKERKLKENPFFSHYNYKFHSK